MGGEGPSPVLPYPGVLGLSPSGYYASEAPPSARARRDRELRRRIEAIFEENRRVYGRPRIHAELQQAGERVGGKRVGRLMREAGIQGASRRRYKPRTTQRDRNTRPAPDLVDRDFTAEAADRLWVADITYIPTWAGFLYLAVVVDAWSRRVVGWSMAAHLRSELVLDALNMASWQRRPQRVIHHSDQGTQYTSIAFGLRCKEVGVRPSMGSVGDAYDNALCFFATLECEVGSAFALGGQDPSSTVRRRHSALGYDARQFRTKPEGCGVGCASFDSPAREIGSKPQCLPVHQSGTAPVWH